MSSSEKTRRKMHQRKERDNAGAIRKSKGNGNRSVTPKVSVAITFEPGHSWDKSSKSFKNAMIKMIKSAYGINTNSKS